MSTELSFLYLIQGSASNVSLFRKNNPLLEILSLTYDQPLSGSFHFPHSTWTDGRNVLYREAEKKEKKYDYYIFMDDDLEIVHGSFTNFEKTISKYQPDVAVAPHTYTRGGQELVKAFKFLFSFKDFIINSDRLFDPCLIAIKVDSIKDYYILPYVDVFDKLNWWLSQCFFCDQLENIGVETLCINTLIVKGTENNPYPKQLNGVVELMRKETKKIYIKNTKTSAEVIINKSSKLLRKMRPYFLKKFLYRYVRGIYILVKAFFNSFFQKRNNKTPSVEGVFTPYFYQRHNELKNKKYDYTYTEVE